MREFYRNEKDKDDPDWGGGGGGSGGGFIISGWSSGDGEDPLGPVEPVGPVGAVGQITPDVSHLRCSVSGRLMLDNTGMLITCHQALFLLGEIYEQERNGKVDKDLAIKYYKAAAIQHPDITKLPGEAAGAAASQSDPKRK